MLRRRLLLGTISLYFTCSSALAQSELPEYSDPSVFRAVSAADPAADSSTSAHRESASGAAAPKSAADNAAAAGNAKSTIIADPDSMRAQLDAKNSSKESAEGIAKKSTNGTANNSAKSSEPVSGIKKWSSFGAGFVLGTPIAMVRRTISQDVIGAGEMPVIGKSKNRVKIWTARAVLLPVCAVGGFVQGPMYSLEQSKKFSSTTPFSKDSFSLGHMDSDW
jgi:hypothetical protein